MLKMMLVLIIILSVSSCATVPELSSTSTLSARLAHDVNLLLEEQLLDGEAATWSDRQDLHVQRTLAVFLSYLENNKICRDYFTFVEIRGEKYSPAFGTSCRVSPFNWDKVRWSYARVTTASAYSHVDQVLDKPEVIRENQSQPSYRTYKDFNEIDNKIKKNVANIKRNIVSPNYVYPYRLSPNLESLITKRQKEYGIDYKKLVDSSCKNHNVNPIIVHAIIQQESSYKPHARSGAGAVGLMQLMPPTANELGVKDSLNPKQNIEGGVKYFRWLLNRDLLKNKIPFALVAYNCGIGHVSKHIRQKGYSSVVPVTCNRNETTNYVKKISKTIEECAKYN